MSLGRLFEEHMDPKGFERTVMQDMVKRMEKIAEESQI
jgi:hypothetical protein